MLLKYLSVTALAATATAQSLTAALSNQSSLSNLTTYLSLYPTFLSQITSLSNITLLAPNNAAFSSFVNTSVGQAVVGGDSNVVEGLFSYHVLNGSYSNFTQEPEFIPTALMPPTYTNVTGGQRVEAIASGDGAAFYAGLLQNATTVGSPIKFDGGMIHIVDSVLTVPYNVSQSAIELGLSSSVGALRAASLVEAVDTLEDVTVFLPDNAAFQAIAGTLATLPTSEIASVLEYHVVNGTVGYSSLLSNTTLQTLNGGNITIRVENGTVFVNSARVLTANVLVANGVVHVIDNVLNPANSTAAPNATISDSGPAFSGASSASQAPYTSGVPTPTSTINTQAVAGATEASTAEGSGAAATSTGIAMPMKTGTLGAAALFGGVAMMMMNM